MKFHINLKTAAAALGGILTIAAAFNWLTADQAKAVTAGVAVILTALAPQDAGQGDK